MKSIPHICTVITACLSLSVAYSAGNDLPPQYAPVQPPPYLPPLVVHASSQASLKSDIRKRDHSKEVGINNEKIQKLIQDVASIESQLRIQKLALEEAQNISQRFTNATLTCRSSDQFNNAVAGRDEANTTVQILGLIMRKTQQALSQAQNTLEIAQKGGNFSYTLTIQNISLYKWV